MPESNPRPQQEPGSQPALEPTFKASEPEVRAAEIELKGEVFRIDEELTQLLESGMPAIVMGCRHGRQVIKQEGVFLVTDDDANVYPGCGCGMGLYSWDTRFLSGWVLRLEGQVPTLLSVSAERNFMSQVEFMNPRLTLPGGQIVHQETIYFSAIRAMGRRVREQIRMVNYNPFDVEIHLSLDFHADFADMFEVRGMHFQRGGVFLRPKVTPSALTLAYLGQDRVLRQTRVSFAQQPDRIEVIPYQGRGAATGAAAHFTINLPGHGAETILEYAVAISQDGIEASDGCATGVAGPDTQPEVPFLPYIMALGELQERHRTATTVLSTNHELYNVVLDRCIRDLASLTIFHDTGPYPSAGIPWFTAPFGRDGIITALQTLMLGPDLALGTLRYLARHQAHDDNPFRDEEPGKIMHELRCGQLANLGIIPHTPYYGSVDSTPLFLVLLSETFRWTGDLGIVRELWDAVEAALMWIEGYGDLDGDGFVEYIRRSPMGLFSQGWKDSATSVIHPDATIAEPPIALAEVQGYVYDAKRRIAELCYLLDLRILGDRLSREAEELKAAFNEAFWDEEMQFYVEALDKDKRPVRTKTSNPGHCLWSGIVPPERAKIMARALLAEDMYSGWGIRTIASSSPVYNPLSYHNGTVWPHDNSIIAKGLADNGFKSEAVELLDALYHASLHFPYYRLPELFCGFRKTGDLDKPVPYPVACWPQAWAAGTPILLLQAALGLAPDAPHNTIHIVQPTLPTWLSEVNLRGLRIGNSVMDLQFIQVNGITSARVLRKEGTIRVVIETI